MNFKKFISGVSALTIAASAFAGMAVTANAETVTGYRATLINECNATTGFNALDGNKNLQLTAPVREGDDYNILFHQVNANASGGYNYDISSATKDTNNVVYDKYKVEFELKGNPQSAGRCTLLNLLDSDNKEIVSIRHATKSSRSAGQGYTIFGGFTELNDSSFPQNVWYNVKAEVDKTTNKLSLSIKNATTTVYEGTVDYDASYGDIAKIQMKAGYSITDEWIDNIVVSTYQTYEETGYTLTTNPYSLVYVDNNFVANSGNSGVVEFDESYDDGNTHTISVTKSGYTSDSIENVYLTKNTERKFNISPSASGVTYYEDFTNVNDNFGFTNDVVVDNGVLTYTTPAGAASGASVSTTFENAINAGDKMVTLEIAATAGDRNVPSITLSGVTYSNYNTSDGKTWRVANQRTYSNAVNGNEYHRLQIVPLASALESGYTANRARFYLDGKYFGEVGGLNSQTITGLSFSDSYSGTGITVDNASISLKSITVATKPVDFALKADDVDTEEDDGNGGTKTNTNITSVTYLDGYTASLTLPAAVGVDGKTFMGWKVQGTDDSTAVAAGTVVTATEATTYVPVYVSTAADITSSVEVGEVVNGTGNLANEQATWYITTVTNNGATAGTFNKMRLSNGTDLTAWKDLKTTYTINYGASFYFGVILDGDTTANTITAEVQ